ncbi:Phage protein [Salmonella enterica subsp. enterica serovar Wandsworth str. A4-580]|uniref:Phage protein n=1 Tax=Salmonella enterica subsp. enterica serovar Wandsworth str. A4-580 TaxID=913086 RepID=G5S7Y1_SALET|nr:Phage protein [Salmonella enterica subsp. enterica serovar Wandsworth str. A4-580]
MYTQKALWYRHNGEYRHNGDREGMRVCLNLSRVEVLNQRYFLGPCPF